MEQETKQARLEAQAKEKAQEIARKLSINKPWQTLKSIFSYLLDFSWVFGLAVLLIIMRSGLGVASNLLLKPIVNYAVAGAGLATVSKYIGYMLLIYLGSALIFYLGERLISTIAENVTQKIRSDLFAKIQSLPIAFFDQRSHGELMSAYTNDLTGLNNALEETLGSIIANFVTFIGLLVIMLMMSPLLTGLVVLTLIIQLFMVKKISQKSALSYRHRQASIADLNAYIEEMISGQKVVKVYNHEAQAIADFDFKNENLRQTGSRATTYTTLMMPIMMNLAYIQFAIIALAGSIMTISGNYNMDIGTLAAFLQATRNFTNPVVQIAQQFNSLIAALAGAERIFAILEEEAEIDQGQVQLTCIDQITYWQIPAPVVKSGYFTGSGLKWSDFIAENPVLAGPDQTYLIPVKGEIVISDLSFGYSPDQMVLKDISLYAKPGQRIAFVGSTGAGKTTIVNLLTRFYEYQAGSIHFDGIDLLDIRKADLRRSLGMVLQDVQLFSTSIRENIRYGRLDASDEEVEAAAKYANAHNFITSLAEGYDHQVSPDGGNISQGQRQLISIARAAVKDPEILILDEATSSVDTRTERHIERGMDQLMEDRTSFAIAHRLSTVRNATAILLLDQGRIIERGNHDQLMAMGGSYYQLNTGKAKLD